jgi:CheY-like chemotaxis protein
MVGDVGQLEQVIMNVVLNARDAIPDGGRLVIRTANITLPDAAHPAPPTAPAGPYVLMAISDTGIGMDAYTKDRLFEPFFTTKALGEGTGLGLSTVYGTVSQLEGFIWVDSELGHGSVFHMCWPAAGAAAVAPPPPVRRPAPFVSRLTILLVEDEETVRRFASKVLERFGFNVIQAGSPEQALSLVGEAGGGDISLMLTDMVMPGMSGLALAEAVKPLRPEMTVLFMSGYPASVNADGDEFDPSTRLLAKPFTAAELLDHVKAALESR